jgi:hypothetical protein
MSVGVKIGDFGGYMRYEMLKALLKAKQSTSKNRELD